METILLVDDEEMILDTFDAFLSFEGYKIFTAFSVEEARQVLKKEKIDLILSDLRMPDEDGLDLVRYLNENYPYLAVIMVTGSPEAQDTYDAYDKGIVEFLVKPVGKKTLLETVRRILDQSSGAGKDSESEEIDNLLKGIDLDG